MLLSILIPFRDKPELLNQCLRSLERFPFRTGAWEILLIDNGSKAKSLERLEKFPSLPLRFLRVDEAFNFQRLNNLGAQATEGQVLLLLNNDIEAIQDAWLDRLYAKACEPTVGAVGCLLLYGDAHTVQHAGVVVGLKRYAEHLYRGAPVDTVNPHFAAPRVSRSVSAVTAACMAIERRKWNEVSGMDEKFVVCGGDVDLCLRLSQQPYTNFYLGEVSALHHESQSRGRQKIPVGDFAESERSYSEYLKGRADPFYPDHLSREAYVPTPLNAPRHTMDARNPKAWIKGRYLAEAIQHGGIGRIFSVWRERRSQGYSQRAYRYSWPKQLVCQLDPLASARRHYFIPHVLGNATFGGITTILHFALEEARRGEHVHFVLHDAGGDWENFRLALGVSDEEWARIGYRFSATNAELGEHIQLRVSPWDSFVATAWWTRLSLENAGVDPARVTYIVQDYEPLFYADQNDAIERQLAQLARKSYEQPCHVKINSRFLASYLSEKQIITPESSLSWEIFEPRLASEFLQEDVAALPKKKQIFVYARPEVHRNRFDLCVETLRMAAAQIPADWKILGAGTLQHDVDLGHGHKIQALGKLPFGDYVRLLRETPVGIALMESPHPSYPPLELAACGARVVCNRYANKNYQQMSTLFRCAELNAQSLQTELLLSLRETKV